MLFTFLITIQTTFGVNFTLSFQFTATANVVATAKDCAQLIEESAGKEYIMCLI